MRGKVDDVGYMDLDYISFIEISSTVLARGYLHMGDLWCTFDDKDWFAIRRLNSDKDVVHLINRSFKEKKSVL